MPYLNNPSYLLSIINNHIANYQIGIKSKQFFVNYVESLFKYFEPNYTYFNFTYVFIYNLLGTRINID